MTYNHYHQHHTPFFRMGRSVSNSNPSLDRLNGTGGGFGNNSINNGGSGGGGNGINNNGHGANDVHVEYEVSVPIVPSFRHTPYHSLWNLHEW